MGKDKSISPLRLSRRQLLQGATALLTFTVIPFGIAAVPQLVAVRLWPSSTYTRVTLESTLPLKQRHFFLTNPTRLVIDIEGVQLNTPLRSVSDLVLQNDPFIKVARAGQFDTNTVRVVLELKQEVNPDIFTLKPIAEFKDRLVVDLYPKNSNISGEGDPLLALLIAFNEGDLNLDYESLPETKPKQDADKNKPWVIVLDPGHGGEDPGAVGKNRTKEKDVVLKIAHQLRKMIERMPNMKVYMTRSDDVFIPLRVRVAKARSLKADLFISIHADAFTNRSARGSSVYALSTKGATSSAAQFLATSQNEADEIGGVSTRGDPYLDKTIFDLVQTRTVKDSLVLGQDILSQIKGINILHKSRVEQAAFVVLRAPDIPSVLVETAFISNLQEEQKLRTTKFQKEIAERIFKGITAFFTKRHIQLSKEQKTQPSKP